MAHTRMTGGEVRDHRTSVAVWRPETMSSVAVLDGVIDRSGAATFELVPAPGVGLFVRVLNYVFSCPSGAAVTWKSGTTPKSGAMTLTNGISVPSAGPGGRQFQCAENQALNITTSLAGNYGGHFTYQLVEV